MLNFVRFARRMLLVGTTNDWFASKARRESLENGEHPTLGTYQTVTSPIKMDGTPLSARGPSPALGAHTDAVLGEVGFSDAELRALREANVVGRYDE